MHKSHRIGLLVAGWSLTYACGDNTNALSLPTGPNVAQLIVDGGPIGADGHRAGTMNGMFTSVTLCKPSSTSCITIDHVLVDTGSFGLRVASSAVTGLNLAQQTDASSSPVFECAMFGGGFIWGPVVTADVTLAEETALAIPVQLIDDSGDALAPAVPGACSSSNPFQLDSTTLGAKGVLGVGFLWRDCGTACATAGGPPVYFGCPSLTTCAVTAVDVTKQVANPAAHFSSDNNGVVIILPPIADGGAPYVTGALVFGIGTRTNNAMGAATVFAANTKSSCATNSPPDCLDISTTYANSAGHVNEVLAASFLDSGTAVLLFPDSSITLCPSSPPILQGLYCPANSLTLTATNKGSNGIAQTLDFDLVSAKALLTNNPNSIAFKNIGGTDAVGGSGPYRGFTWGAPFFFGRTVFTAFLGSPTPAGTGPYWAF